MRGHTHIASIANGIPAFISVCLIGTFWRLAWLHAMTINNRHVQGIARAALLQF